MTGTTKSVLAQPNFRYDFLSSPGSCKEKNIKMKALIVLAGFVLTAHAAPFAMADNIPADPAAQLKQKEDELNALQKEYALIQEKLKMLESTPSITCERLAAKNHQRLKEITADVKTQRQTMAEFEGFVKWMAGNLSGYSKYIEAGSVAAGFARVLPIPYAGQASVFTKFVSQGILSLNSASVAINKYLVTSQQFITKVDGIDPAHPNPADVAEAGRFADENLLHDMSDLRLKLTSTAELSSSTLSFLESLNHYVGSTDEYWKKTKSFITRGDDKKEKSFLSESIAGLKSKAGSFNGRLKTFDEAAQKNVPLIKTLGAYNELIRELNGKVAAVK